jgi:hypothetical protein
MNNPDRFSESLETIFWAKILKFFDAIREPGWKKLGSGMGKARIWDKHPESATPVPRSVFSLPVSVFRLIQFSPQDGR